MPRPLFPKSLPEFMRQFPDEEAAMKWIVEARWPDGFDCPRCHHNAFYARTAKREFECGKCGYVVSVTAQTVMHKTRTPLVTWLLCAWIMVTDKRGVSAAQIERQLGLRHETAFQMLHKLRAAMVAPERTLLRGVVEVDESQLGAARRGRPAGEVFEKVHIVGAVEVHEFEGKKGTGTRPGRIRLRLVPARTKEHLLTFVGENVEPGSTVVTDALAHYANLRLGGYKRRIESTTLGMAEADILKHYHLVISNLKTWLAGTFHGRVEPKHLQAYLNEYVFRFNRRGNLYAAFARLLGIGTRVRGPEYEQLYADEGEEFGWAHPNPKPSLARGVRG